MLWNPNADKHKIGCLAKLVSIYIVCWDRVSFPYSFRTTNLVVDEKREKISFPHVQSVELAWLTHFFMFIDKVNLHLFVGYKYNWQIRIQLTNIQIQINIVFIDQVSLHLPFDGYGTELWLMRPSTGSFYLHHHKTIKKFGQKSCREKLQVWGMRMISVIIIN